MAVKIVIVKNGESESWRLAYGNGRRFGTAKNYDAESDGNMSCGYPWTLEHKRSSPEYYDVRKSEKLFGDFIIVSSTTSLAR